MPKERTSSAAGGCWFDTTLAAAIAVGLGAIVIPNALRDRKAAPEPVSSDMNGDHYFDTNQAGVIFYTTGQMLALDTNTAILPNTSGIPEGK